MLRFFTVATIVFLLLKPLIKKIEENAKTPIIALMIDNSKSMASKSIAARQGALPTVIQPLYEQLAQSYQVDLYQIDQDIRQIEAIDSMKIDGSITNLSHAVEYISEIYEGENLGAVLLISDGIYNEGKNPLYAQYTRKSPIYTIAWGDTTRRKDVVLKQVLYNSVAFLNDEMITEVDVQSFNTSGDHVELTVQKISNTGSPILYRKKMVLSDPQSLLIENVTLALTDVGVNHFRYAVSPLNGETNKANNVKDVYIDVLDARLKIAIVAAAPHPDIATLKQILERNKNYEVQIFLQNPSSSELNQLDLIIFHELPSQQTDMTGIIDHMNRNKIPRMFILSAGTNLDAFTEIQDQAMISSGNGSVNNAQAIVQGDFSSFTLSPQLKDILPSFPPLSAPFGEYKLKAGVQVLLKQRIGNVETDFPLLAFSDQNRIKTTFLFGTDLWRWKLYEYAQYDQIELLSELLEKTIMYTTTKEDKRKFRVYSDKKIYAESEAISLSAELYNSSYELINAPDVFMTLTNEDGTDYPFTFSKKDKTYLLNAGRLPRGRYTYLATTSFNGEQYEAVGGFSIRETQLELYDLQAKHNVLYALTQKYGGKMYYPDQIDQLADEINNNDHIKPIIYQNVISRPLLNQSWILALLVSFLTLEWILRRYFGNL